jgi:hypothetical protein
MFLTFSWETDYTVRGQLTVRNSQSGRERILVIDSALYEFAYE